MNDKKRRAQNFTYAEKHKLLKIICQYKTIVLNKKTDAVTKKIKSAAWANITTKFNYCRKTPRTKKSLVKIWEKMKGDAKTYKSLPDGGYTESLTPEQCDLVMEHISAVLEHYNNEMVDAYDDCGAPDILLPRHEIKDSSDDDNNYPLDGLGKVECLMSVEQQSWSHNQSSFQNDLKNEVHNEANGYSEASSTNSSFNDSNGKLFESERNKLLLEQELEYRKQMYEQELEFKNKMYSLQIKTAEQELKIKEAILARIQDGRIELSDLLGSQTSIEDLQENYNFSTM